MEINKLQYYCNICDRCFKTSSGLWKHEKKCKHKEETPDDNSEQTYTHTPTPTPTHTHAQLQEETENFSSMKSIFHHMLVENKELRELLVEQSKQSYEIQQKMIEIASEGKVINNSNTINNKFNLNFFLNEQCKNAMNLTEFLNTIEVQVEDVTNMGRLGFAEGISRIFMKALNNLDVYERPIHCSDIKREMMYIKDNGIWEKDSNMKDHMKRAIKCISFKNIRKLADWRDANPGWSVLHSQLEEDYLHITSESMGGSSSEEDVKLYNKIIRKVANEVMIDKNML